MSDEEEIVPVPASNPDITVPQSPINYGEMFPKVNRYSGSVSMESGELISAKKSTALIGELLDELQQRRVSGGKLAGIIFWLASSETVFVSDAIRKDLNALWQEWYQVKSI